MKRRLNPDDTRDRIIRAAGEIFGRRGFDGTTIRQITKRAAVNVAAVNYHFRDKAELYLRVLREAKNETSFNAMVELEGDAPEQLRGFILGFLRALLDPDRPAWHLQVITQEMLRPTPALDTIVREMTEPVFRKLRGVIAQVVGLKLAETELDLLASSVIGQCLFYVRSQAMLQRLAPALMHGPGWIDRLAAHVGAFSLAALQQLYQNKGKPAGNRRTFHPNRLPVLQTS